MSSLSWTPVRRGNIYCSSACGGDCRYTDYLYAVRKAAALAAKLGRGWAPRVWENLGWHYSAINGTPKISVYPPDRAGHGEYWASVVFGRQFTAYHKDPRKAFARAVAAGDFVIAEILAARAALNTGARA